MITEIVKELVTSLIEVTNEDRLKWESTALDKQYLAVMGENAVCIGHEDDNIAMSVMKKGGEEAIKVIVRPSDEDYSMFSQLFQLIQLKNEANQEMIKQLIEVINQKSNKVNYSDINELKD